MTCLVVATIYCMTELSLSLTAPSNWSDFQYPVSGPELPTQLLQQLVVTDNNPINCRRFLRATEGPMYMYLGRPPSLRKTSGEVLLSAVIESKSVIIWHVSRAR